MIDNDNNNNNDDNHLVDDDTPDALRCREDIPRRLIRQHMPETILYRLLATAVKDMATALMRERWGGGRYETTCDGFREDEGQTKERRRRCDVDDVVVTTTGGGDDCGDGMRTMTNDGMTMTEDDPK